MTWLLIKIFIKHFWRIQQINMPPPLPPHTPHLYLFPLGKTQPKPSRVKEPSESSLHIFPCLPPCLPSSLALCATAASTLQLPHAKLANYSLAKRWEEGEKRKVCSGFVGGRGVAFLSGRNKKRQPDEQLAG